MTKIVESVESGNMKYISWLADLFRYRKKDKEETF